ncbi:uncharacterized protein [Temnothorax longispinosus]|uniref:uncharacterized protein n=1 Tax=Temnothorax longispinosus TaxID=300112 RepID=UPI003A996848
MILGTWNTRSLYRTGALKALCQETMRYRIDVLAVQETRWTGEGVYDTRTHTILHSGNKDRHELGVAFLVDRRFKDRILNFTAINERVCVIRLKTKFFNLSIINAHAETEEKDEVTKDNFYSGLEQAFDTIPSNGIKMVIGDLNAKIGKELTYRDIVGLHSLHEESNDNGLRVIDLATAKNMVVKSTQLPRKNIHKWTWESPDGDHHNQIDHVLIERRNASSITNVRTCRGADCDSDHYLVRVCYRCRISRRGTEGRAESAKINTGRLKDPETKHQYQQVLAEKIHQHADETEPHTTMETDWDRLKRAITTSAETSLGERPRERRNEWFDRECEESIRKKNKDRQTCMERPTRAKRDAYKQSRKEASKLIKKKKREHLNNYIAGIEEDFRSKNCRRAYRSINTFKKGFVPRTTLCRDGSGNIMGDSERIKRTWKDFFQELLNPHGRNGDEPPEEGLRGQEPQIESPSLAEVEEAIKKLKNNRAPGADNIPAELLKYGGDSLATAAHQLIGKIWDNEQIPEEWQLSIICPIHKKGDKLLCKNYRGISLLCTMYKVLTTIIKTRLEQYAEDIIIGEYQAGFRPNRSTTDQLFTVRHAQEKCWEYNVELLQLFVDFKQAYDSIDRNMLYKILLDFGIPPKLVRLIRMTMLNTRCKVKINQELTDAFEVARGLKQGDGLAPTLFNLVLEYVIRRTIVDTNATIMSKSRQIVGYADDLNVMGRSMSDVEEAFNSMESAASSVGLEINEDKTKLMRLSRNPRRRLGQSVTIGTHKFETVDEFVYLGSNLNKNNDEMVEIRRRVTAANRMEVKGCKSEGDIGSPVLDMASSEPGSGAAIF